MNSNLIGNASMMEILWTLSTVPGLYIWVVNLFCADQARRYAVRMNASAGSKVWSRFSVLLTSVFAFVEVVFLLVGVIALVRPPNPGAESTTWLQWVLTGGFIGSSALISFVGLRWRAVDQYLVASARARKTTAQAVE